MISRFISKFESSKYMEMYCNHIKPKLYRYKLKKTSNFQLNSKPRDNKIIVSMTTMSSRINVVWLSLSTLMNQTVKPDKVILWLDNSFENQKLPFELNKLQKLGIDIKFCNDLKAHKKYYYTLKKYVRDIVITVDDDVFYPRYFIKRLMIKHQQFPKDVICYRAHRIKFDENGKLLPYKQWEQNSPKSNQSSHLLLATGVSGVLYPPHSLYKDTLNQDLFTKLAPYCDDLWLKMMEIQAGTKVRKVFAYSIHFPLIRGSQEVGLFHKNVEKNNNDIEMNNLLNYYKNIDFRKLD